MNIYIQVIRNIHMDSQMYLKFTWDDSQIHLKCTFCFHIYFVVIIFAHYYKLKKLKRVNNKITYMELCMIFA